MNTVKRKSKKCKVCKNTFILFQSTQQACSIKCAIALSKELEEKKERKKLQARRQELKPLSKLANEAQAAFNLYIRLRDWFDPCISCQRHHKGQYHAGHYISVGHAKQLRFNEDNCHKQCSACNNHLSGNIAMYRIHLVHKIGIEQVEALENNKAIKKYTRDELNEFKTIYKEKAKVIKKGLH